MKKILLAVFLIYFVCVSGHNLFPETNNSYKWEVPATKDSTLYIIAKYFRRRPELLYKVGFINGRKDTLYMMLKPDKNELELKLSSELLGVNKNNFGVSFLKVLDNKKLNPEGMTKLLESSDKKVYIYSDIKKEKIPEENDENLYHNECKEENWDLTFSEIERTDNYSIVKYADKTGYDPVGSGLFIMHCIYKVAKLRGKEYWFAAIDWRANEEHTYLGKVYFFNDKGIKLKKLLGDDYSHQAQERFDRFGYWSVEKFGELFINPKNSSFSDR